MTATWQHSGEAPAVLPSVSVVIPTRERPDPLRQAVRAVLDQRYAGLIECIIVFDQSEVNLPDVEIPHGRTLTGIVNTRTPGLAGARNTGAVAATGALLASCDDDDEWMPHKLDRQVELLLRDSDAIAVGAGILLRSSGRTISRIPTADRIDLRDLLRSRRMELHSSNILVRRDDFVERVGLIDESLPNSQNEDYDWLLRAARFGSIAMVREALVRVNFHQRSFFAQRWETLVAAHLHLLARHPEFRREPTGLARIYGQIAFYQAAAGHRRSAREWAFRTMRLNLLERRSYLALAVSTGLVSANRIVGWANARGKGI
jgi:glycosyltransferase involved in cell wall biosynthesis